MSHPAAHRDGYRGVDFIQVPSGEYRKLVQLKARMYELIETVRAETAEYQALSGEFSPEYEAKATLNQLLYVVGIES